MSKLTLAVAGLLGVALLGFAQEEADFQKWMKEMGSANDVLRKLPAKTGADAAASAEKIAAAYTHTKDYWVKRNISDAIKWSDEGKEAADKLAAAAKAGDADVATASLKALGGTCRSCHEVHREKLPDGTYKIK